MSTGVTRAVGVPSGNYDLVYEINKALDQVRESDQYATLMKTYLASKSEAFMKPVAGRKTHRVVPGDTLGKIARQELGNSERWEQGAGRRRYEDRADRSVSKKSVYCALRPVPCNL